MLRWTCRLRDVLQPRPFLASKEHQRRLAAMREAEFISSNGMFPDEFRWEMLSDCFDGVDRGPIALCNRNSPRPRLVVAVNNNPLASREVRSLCGQPVTDFTKGDISVLWLSPTIFISPIWFYCVDVYLHDYTLIFEKRIDLTWIQCCVYSLSAFEGGGWDEPTPFPAPFFQHLTARLPANFFSTLTLQRNRTRIERCPVDCIVQFLSLFPIGVLSQPMTEEQSTKFILDGCITADELRVILSHHFHPTAILEFPRYSCDKSVSSEVMIDLLNKSQYLRCIQFSPQLFPDTDRVGLCTDLEMTVKSPKLSIRSTGLVSAKLLHVMSRLHHVNDIAIAFDKNLWEKEQEQRQQLLADFIHPFLDGRFTLENLQIGFGYIKSLVSEAVDWESTDGGLSRVTEWVAGAMISCNSKSLCMFNISLSVSQGDDCCRRRIDRIQRWDKSIFPRLVLNYFCRILVPPKDRRTVPAAVRVINQGVIYHKTTGHVPDDMGPANAGLIFSIVKSHLRNQSQILENPSMSTVSGTKRAAPM
jgi:hypothetical protein